jgi:hypothetical protein
MNVGIQIFRLNLDRKGKLYKEYHLYNTGGVMMDDIKKEQHIGESDREKRLQITRKIFEEILAADLHQSEIANRLLIPVTFLTSAATFLFGFMLNNDISLFWGEINVIPVFFLLYMAFTIGGIFVFFEVIGPSFYTKQWPVPEKGPKGPPSALFFKLISKVDDVNKWVSYFSNREEKTQTYLDIDELQDKLIYDFSVESFQLAKKVHEKSRKNLFAHMFFYPSFCLLLLMAFSGVISLLEEWNLVAWMVMGFIVAFFVIIEAIVIRKYIKF